MGLLIGNVAGIALATFQARTTYNQTVMDTPANPSRRTRRKTIVLSLLALFLLPIAARAALFAYEGGPTSWRNADWSSTGSLPDPGADAQARVLIMSGRTGGWKGVFSVHSWVVLKPENARSWRRYDVVGWGNPVRTNGWAPDGRWFGDNPVAVVDVSGPEATALIPKIEAAIRTYEFAQAGDYRVWPGPNSNTFTATVLRAAPELAVAMPPEALGRDFRADGSFVGATASRTSCDPDTSPTGRVSGDFPCAQIGAGTTT